MVQLGFSEAIAWCVAIPLTLILAGWVFCSFIRRSSKGPDPFDPAGHVKRCPYCGYLLVDHYDQQLVVCPTCHSYFEEEPDAEEA